ncbi:MAG: hypothetical protein M3Y17_12065 [Actinomycetota bacterium]|nr:hypothetical protein [Actinomycetota bacterium]
MTNDTVTLGLQGDVSLAKFADAVRGFANLIQALSAEERVPSARWEVTGLEAGSAAATATGIADGAEEGISRVVVAYLEVGRALMDGTTIPYAAHIRDHAVGLARLLGDGVDAITFETADDEATIVAAPPTTMDAPTALTESWQAYGTVTGRVQTLTNRSRLRFVLYDALHDKAVSCYIAEGMEDEARDIWGKLATVEGWVSRDPVTDRPLSVRRIRRIVVDDEGDPRGYERARGAVPRGEKDRAEIRIRRVRDAWR